MTAKLPQNLLPEERVRRTLIDYLVIDRGFKRSLLITEKKLSLLPHVQSENLPLRRCDVICFAKGIHPKYELFPLVLIECKATKIEKSTFDQVIGYNHYIRSFYIAVANEFEIWIGWREGDGQYHICPEMPTYQELIDRVRSGQQ